MAHPIKPPGRLGDPNMSLATDPRTNINLAKALKPLRMDINVPENRITPATASMAQIKKMMAKVNAMEEQTADLMPRDLPGDKTRPEVDCKTVTIKGVDGNDVNLYVYRRADSGNAKLPCVVYIHGGGMVHGQTLSAGHVHWCKGIAIAGSVCIAIDFRNAFLPSSDGGIHHPFPAGLNDCASGVQHIASHKSELGISSLVLQGESGGANLAIATTLKAKRDGWMKEIDGVYACVPYISGIWHRPQDQLLKELPSLIENNGYFLQVTSMALMAKFYTPDDKDLTNPLAWPYHATVDELKGLPPFVLVMDELDPLRDEGIAFGRKLVQAGVGVTSSVNLGVIHATSLIFRQPLPELHFGTINNIVAFAQSCREDSGTPIRPKLS
ncbi:unnamed protein product [Zymoseptoria tritici ST99CH_1E4]|uniref:Alpha/beta hydrolase fold-3 domain-containing protein n=1 Tax=Zymoseptoria tritici ST99CH_1E4 TaxID=1276532 RepID=A0A2H1FKD5_ZYMTR|nr:unnamed protein product [Zymoseptoria tritici ST99CH_1E4]